MKNECLLRAEIQRLRGELVQCRAFWAAEADGWASRSRQLLINASYWEGEARTLRSTIKGLEALAENREAYYLRSLAKAERTR